MSVTVLIPTWNSAKTIKKCIDSVLALDYPVDRVLVVDGHSTDGTRSILAKYGPKIDVMQIEGPVPVAWNFGLKHINTDYVAFTDSDCEVATNWLRKLMLGFNDEKYVVATAGFCGTPETDNKLQKVIGLELEQRFKQFPRYISRAPTMNLCVRTELAKKLKFNEKIVTSSEVDFGWRLSRVGKIKYVPEAKVVHHHRPTWQSYFKQQFNYGRYMFMNYFRMGHRKKLEGDHISTARMILQIPLFVGFLLTLFVTAFWFPFILMAIPFGFLLVIIYWATYLEFEIKEDLFITFMNMSVLRNAAWCWGICYGVVDLIRVKM